MQSEIYQLDNTQKLKVMSETGQSVEVELYLKDYGEDKWNCATTFYFEDKKALDLFYNVCNQVLENEKFSN